MWGFFVGEVCRSAGALNITDQSKFYKGVVPLGLKC